MSFLCFLKFVRSTENIVARTKRVFVFPGPRRWPWHPASTCNLRPQLQFVFTGPCPKFVFTVTG